MATIAALWQPYIVLLPNLVEKSMKINQDFFPEKTNIKRAQKRGFIKIVNIAPILAYIYDMALRPLPLGVGTTIVLQFLPKQILHRGRLLEITRQFDKAGACLQCSF